MLQSQKALISACQEIGLEFEVIHEDQISVVVKAGKYRLYFTHWHNPFNRTDIRRIAKDKDLSYTVLSNVINVPRWKAYLDPKMEDIYPTHAEGRDIMNLEEIIDDIRQNFELPFVIKPNMKSMGKNVQIINSVNEIKQALQLIYTQDNRDYDYIAIAQERIDIAHEYRVLNFRSEVKLAYEKSVVGAKFTGNISPLHWDGGKAVRVIDPMLLQRLEEFCNPVYDVIDIEYGGFDIAIDTNDEMWMIELNNNPALGHFIADCGDEAIKEMYKEILSEMSQD